MKTHDEIWRSELNRIIEEMLEDKITAWEAADKIVDSAFTEFLIVHEELRGPDEVDEAWWWADELWRTRPFLVNPAAALHWWANVLGHKSKTARLFTDSVELREAIWVIYEKYVENTRKDYGY